MVSLSNITKEFKHSRNIGNQVFLNADFSMENFKSVALMGRSGSGKSTLLSIIAGLDIKYSGKYYFRQKLLPKDSETMANFRLNHIGVITQNYQLLNDRNIFENIAFPLRYQDIEKKEIHDRVLSVSNTLNLSSCLMKLPNQLSGGQCQLVAIARAIIKNPDLIIADEPTGSLDVESEKEVLKVLSLLMENNQSMIIATHSDQVSSYCDIEFRIDNHKLARVR